MVGSPALVVVVGMRVLVQASTLFAPIVALAGLSSFVFEASVAAIGDVWGLFVVFPLAALVASVLGQSRYGWLVLAHFASLATFALAVYAAAVSASSSGRAPFESLPLDLGLLASGWACVVVPIALGDRWPRE
jgi:hypothetical protein